MINTHPINNLTELIHALPSIDLAVTLSTKIVQPTAQWSQEEELQYMNWTLLEQVLTERDGHDINPNITCRQRSSPKRLNAKI